MLLRLQGERVHVDADSGDVGVVLVRLDPVEVVAITNLEAVVAVKLQESSDARVLASHTLDTSDGVARLENGAVPPVRVVKRLLSLPRVDDVVIAADEGVTLNDPDKLLARVVEVELELVRRGGDRLTTSELEDVNEVLMRDLGELAALVRVEVDVVDVQRGSRETALANTVADGMRVRGVRVVPAQVVQGVELQVDADLVVLKSNQRQRQTRVAAEPELQRNVQSVHRRAAGNDLRGKRLTAIAVVVTARTTLVDQVGQLRDVTDHLGVTGLLSRLLRELVPNVEPVTIMLINTLATDLNLNVADDVVTNPVEPSELSTRAVRRLELNLRQSSLEVHAVDQITITLNGAGDLLAEVRSTVERVLDRLHREVGVTTIHDLEDKVIPSLSGYLRRCSITQKYYILQL